MTCNTAVFYDVENLISLFNARGNKTLQLDEIHRRILDLDVVCGISVQKAYADWALQINRNLRSYVLQIGIEPVQIFNTNQNDKVKNAADVSLIIDAVELISKRPEIENYVIASGDGIFAFLAKKLHEYGKRVIGCGFDRNTNITFKNACDIFLALEKSDAALTAVVKNFNKGTILLPPPVEDEPQLPPASYTPYVPPPAPPGGVYQTSPHPAASGGVYQTPPHPSVSERPAASGGAHQTSPLSEIKIPNKLPKNKFTETLITKNFPIWKNAQDYSGSLHIIKRMITILFEGAQNDTDLEISLLKAYVEHYLPNFRIGQYGFKRFGEFMRFVVSASPYCLVISEGTVVRIARRDALRENGDVLMDDMPNLLFTLKDGSKVKSLFEIDQGVVFTYDLESKPEPSESPMPSEARESTELPRVPSDAVESGELPQVPPDSPVPHDDPVQLGQPKGTDSVRKWIKNTFTHLSREGKLAVKEVKQLLTPEYAQKTFGIRIPVLKELSARAQLREQRLVDGKIKYWKDEFVFNGKSYLIFKEWTDKQHRAKFEAWLARVVDKAN